MAEFGEARLWLRRASFILLACVITLVHLVPLDLRPSTWAPPDLLLAFACAWVARRPDYLPVYCVAVIFLTTDLLLQRPPGLWAALVVLLTEAIRNRHRDLRAMPFLAEWGFVALGLTVITLANRFVLAIVMTPQAPIGMTLMQLGATILIYPVAVVVTKYIFGVVRPAPGDLRKIGQRL